MVLRVVVETAAHAGSLRTLFATLPWSVMSMRRQFVAVDSEASEGGVTGQDALGAVRYDLRSGFVSLVIVAPAQRRRGVGALLLSHVVEDIVTAGERGVRAHLLVLGSDLASQPWLLDFYTKHGFQVQGPGPTEVGTGQDVRLVHEEEDHTTARSR
jgi:GNAT superfamily N-acetyltransferase